MHRRRVRDLGGEDRGRCLLGDLNLLHGLAGAGEDPGLAGPDRRKNRHHIGAGKECRRDAEVQRRANGDARDSRQRIEKRAPWHVLPANTGRAERNALGVHGRRQSVRPEETARRGAEDGFPVRRGGPDHPCGR
jgi:hypothetical protein